MAWVKLTTPTGKPVYIANSSNGANASIDLESGGVEHVTETHEQVAAMLGWVPPGDA